MALETFAVGPYAGTWSAASLGITEGGYTITHDQKAEAIEESDLYGATMLDFIWRGANVFCDFTVLAFTKGSPVLTPFVAGLYTVWSTAKPVGTLASDNAAALVLTATANTPAATTGPATLTANKAIVAPNFSTAHLYDSRLRKLPLRMQFIPYSSTNIIFATTT